MTFAQALARIEELSKLMKGIRLFGHAVRRDELRELCDQHADAIVQLGKVAAEMFAVLEHAKEFGHLGGGSTANWASQVSKAYDKLLKGE